LQYFQSKRKCGREGRIWKEERKENIRQFSENQGEKRRPRKIGGEDDAWGKCHVVSALGHKESKGRGIRKNHKGNQKVKLKSSATK